MDEETKKAVAELAMAISRAFQDFSEKITGMRPPIVDEHNNAIKPAGPNGRYTSEQASYILDIISKTSGMTSKRLCEMMGISEITACTWRRNPASELNSRTHRKLVDLIDEYRNK